MFEFFKRAFSDQQIVPEVRIAIMGKLPDEISVKFHKSKDGGYWAEIKNLPGCITQAKNGQELFVMVNDAVYTYFNVPEKYFPYIRTYLPPEEIREAMRMRIPDNLLNKELGFKRA